MTIEKIDLWHKRARPEPTVENFNVQLGCHIEEFVEMLDALDSDSPYLSVLRAAANIFATDLKAGIAKAIPKYRTELLDSLADQIVTSIGVGHCAKMDVPEACERVNMSNWSKYVNGQPVFNENGKIIKGPDYLKPNLEGLY